jgi:hypothetical protein
MKLDERVEFARQVLKVTFGVVPFLAGLDKFFNLLADWPRYLSPLAESILPISGQTFMYVAGVVEMAVGTIILTRWTAIGSWIAAAWLVAVAVNLVAAGYFDVAVRDLVMAMGAFALAQLTEAHDAVSRGATPAIETTERRTRVGQVA